MWSRSIIWGDWYHQIWEIEPQGKSNDTQTITTRKKEEIETIATKNGAYNPWIFGSVARKEETETSDIDFLIDYDINKVTAWFPSGLIQDLEALLNRKVDVVTTNSLHYIIRDKVLREVIPLWKMVGFSLFIFEIVFK